MDSKPRTLPLKLAPSSQTGVYTLSRQWPAEDTWVLTFIQKRRPSVSTLVSLEPSASSAKALSRKDAAGAAVGIASIRMVHYQSTAKEVEVAMRKRV